MELPSPESLQVKEKKISLLLTSHVPLSPTDLTKLHKGENDPHFCDHNSKAQLKSRFNMRCLFHAAGAY